MQSILFAMRREYRFVLGWRVIVLICAITITAGCTHTVRLGTIAQPNFETKISESVRLVMDNDLQKAEHSFSAWSSGIANEWVVPYGERVYDFAEVYLTEAFLEYRKVSSQEWDHSDVTVNITDVTYDVKGQAAHIRIAVEFDRRGMPTAQKSYSASGPSGAALIMTVGGAFAQKGMIRRSTERALHEIFGNLVRDLRPN